MQDSDFVRKYEPVARYTAHSLILKWPALASEEEDLRQVARIAIHRSRLAITSTDVVAFQLREARQAAKNAQHRYLATYFGWRRGVVDESAAAPTRGPARLKAAQEGSDSLVWGMLSVESHERQMLIREELASVEAALLQLTPAQRNALLDDEPPPDRATQCKLAQLRLTARKNLKKRLAG